VNTLEFFYLWLYKN